MSPEQAAGEPVGPASDLYSLGVVLYEMLTGGVPFEVVTPEDVPAEQAKGPPRPPSEANSEVSEALDAAVAGLLATDPAARHGSAAGLIADLRRVRYGLPKAVPSPNEATTAASGDPLAPDPHAYGDATRGRRSSRGWSWTLAVLAALIAVLGVASWELLREPGGNGIWGAAGGAERAQPGQGKVEVPAVKGLSEREARGRLAKAGFGVGVRSRESPEKDTGKVLGQSVAGGKEVNKGSKILLAVGGGQRVTKAPSLVGLTYSEAANELEQAGFLLGGVKEAPSETVSAGVILAQDPPAGSTLEQHSYVYLTTSVGPPEETNYGY